MKILLTSDWQAHPRNLHLCDQVLDVIEMYASRVDLVIHLGDIKDAWNPVDQRVTNFIVKATKRITTHVPFILLKGNHDTMGVDDSLPSCLPVVEGAGGVGIDTPTIYPFGGVKLTFVPYIRDPETLRSGFQGLSGDYLFFHCEVKGAKLNQEVTSEGGVTTKDMRAKGYKSCFGGHLHLPSRVQNTNIHYVGSPFPCDWGEVNQRKRMVLLDTQANTFTNIHLDIETYHDPLRAGFRPRRSWTERDVIRLPAIYNEHSNLHEVTRLVRDEGNKKYAPARLHIIPTPNEDSIDSPTIDPRGKDDKELITEFLDHQGQTAPSLTSYILHHLQDQEGASPEEIEFVDTAAVNTLSYERVGLKFKPGLTLITGRNEDWDSRSNGTGKTNLLSLPALALQGTNSKGQRHDHWRRDGCDSAAVVSLTIRVHDNELTIVRSRSPVYLHALQGGNNILSGDSKQSQLDLEHLTGLSKDTLLNSLYIDQVETNTLLTGTEKERKALLARFLGLERFQEVEKIIRKDVRNHESQFVSSDEEWDHLGVEIAKEVGVLEHLGQSSLVVLEARFREMLATFFRADRAYRKHPVPTEEEQTTNYEVLSKAYEERNNLENIRYSLERDIEALQGVRGECPLCRQKVARAHTSRHIRALSKDLIEAQEKGTLVSTQIRELETRSREFSESKERLEVLSVDRWKASRPLSDAVDKIDVAERIEDLRRLTEKRLVTLRKAREATDEYRAELRLMIEMRKRALAAVSRDGLPAFLIATICPRLNAAADFYSNLFSEGEIRVGFSIADDRSLDVQVVNVSGSQDLSGQSRGEMRMASLITSFAIRDVLTKFNLLILDEPGDGLDSTNAQVFAKALPSVVERFGCVLVTSHNAHIISALTPDYHIEVTKKDGVSSVTINETEGDPG